MSLSLAKKWRGFFKLIFKKPIEGLGNSARVAEPKDPKNISWETEPKARAYDDGKIFIKDIILEKNDYTVDGHRIRTIIIEFETNRGKQDFHFTWESLREALRRNAGITAYRDCVVL